LSVYQAFETSHSLFEETRDTVIIYLDDILILNESNSGTEEDFALTVSVLEQCGFLVNREKSVRGASWKMEYLGLLADSHFLNLYLSQRKNLKYY
jgi:hypothetical protein